MKPTLLIMAAGIGSRYGGAKQIAPVGPSGERIIDYTMYDAYRAGFHKVVFLINRALEADFIEVVGEPVSHYMDVDYAFQEIPEAYAGLGRKKPLGTAEAVLLCKDLIDAPFAVVNSDDYYGAGAFRAILPALEAMERSSDEYAMLGYRIENTLTENGKVARGVCRVEDGLLREIVERTHIEKRGTCAEFTEDGKAWTPVPAGTPVSMNFWGFTPDVFAYLAEAMDRFEAGELREDAVRRECYLPNVVGALLREERVKVRCIESPDRWYGLTYREDTPAVVKALKDLTGRGVYPTPLWDLK